MVMSTQEQFRSLLAETRLYLLQEYSSEDWLESTSELCDFFRTRLQVRSAPPKIKAAPVAAVAAPRPSPPPVVTPKPPIPSSPKPVAKEARAAAPPPPTEPKNAFALQPPGPPSTNDLAGWRKIVSDVAPRLPILEAPTTLAAPQATTATAAYLIIDNAAPLPHQLLLKDLAQALTLHDLPTRLISTSQLQQIRQSDTVKTIFVCESYKTRLPSSIDSDMLFVLPECQQLLADPDKKQELWQKILQRLSAK